MMRNAALISVFALCIAFAVATEPADEVEVNEKMSQDQLEAELAKIRDEVEKLRQEHDVVFQEGDKDKNGIMSPDEFYAVQLEDDPSLSQQELEEAFADHDTDGSGGLDLKEWQKPFEDTVEQMMQTSEHNEEEHIAAQRAEFESFDTNQDQFLDADELKVLAQKVNEEELEGVEKTLTGEEVLEALDADMDKKVSFEEYVLDGRGMYEDYEDMYGPESVPDSEEYLDHLDDLSLDDIAGDGELEVN